MSVRDGTTAAEHWLSIHDELLRALAHAISNRLATITAAAGLLDARELPDARFIEGLQHDADRLDGLLQLLRQLPRRTEAGAEPLLVTDALDAARRLLAEHPLLRERTVRTVLAGDVMPVRADPVALVHAICVAVLAVARARQGTLDVELETVGDETHLRVRGAHPDGNGAAEGSADGDAVGPADEAAIGWLVGAYGGRGERTRDACAIALPTLQASRRRPA